MAAVSAWGKPGAWALDAEEHEAAETATKKSDGFSDGGPAATEFPSLADAASSKTSKKKKPQSQSLAEFHNKAVSSKGGLTPDELVLLPTGPRERSAEELERGHRGFNFMSYGGGRARGFGEDSNSNTRGPSRVSDEPRRTGFGGGSNRDLGPSRADEVDDWGAGKRLMVPDRRERSGGFFDSHSRADDSGSWISNKGTIPPADGRRRGGFELFNSKEGSNGSGTDSETWGKKRETDSDTWLKKEEPSSGTRPRLMLQPRSLPLCNVNISEQNQGDLGEKKSSGKGSSPFGAARPREEVLAKKGQDWKEIDEKLEAARIREAPLPERSSTAKNGLGMGNGKVWPTEDRTERAWKKPDAAEASPPREEIVEDTI